MGRLRSAVLEALSEMACIRRWCASAGRTASSSMARLRLYGPSMHQRGGALEKLEPLLKPVAKRRLSRADPSNRRAGTDFTSPGRAKMPRVKCACMSDVTQLRCL